jgi:hypothetical protein
MLVTEASLKRLIQVAQETGADAAYIEELKDDLLRLQSKGLYSHGSNDVHTYERTEADGSHTVRISTAPLDEEHDDVFEEVSLKSIK